MALLGPVLVLAAAFASHGIFHSSAVQAASHGAPIPGHYIVILNPGVSVQDVEADQNVSADQRYDTVLHGFSARLSDTQRDALRRDRRVNNVVQDQTVQAQPFRPAAPASPVLAAAETIPTGIDRIDAEGAPASTAHIAIIDTGIDLTHPDLNVAPAAQRFSVFPGSTCNDGNGHGTHVSGIAAAIAGNGIGVRGVAPGAVVHCVQVLDASGSGSFDGVISGINWVTANAVTYGILAANMSLGGCYTDSNDECVPPPGNATCGMSGAIVVDPVHKAICDSVSAGVVHVVAAGNSAADAITQIPAAYQEVITVSAIADYNGKGPAAGAAPASCFNYGPDDSFASFTNFGAAVDIAAPGVCIYSTYKNGGYATLSGTSMAAPHVTGAVAAYLRTHPTTVTLATWPSVEAALITALSRPRTDPACGTTSTNHGFNEPVLYVGQPLANCGGLVGTPTATPTPSPATSTPTATLTRTSTPTAGPATSTPTRTPTPAPSGGDCNNC